MAAVGEEPLSDGSNTGSVFGVGNFGVLTLEIVEAGPEGYGWAQSFGDFIIASWVVSI